MLREQSASRIDPGQVAGRKFGFAPNQNKSGLMVNLIDYSTQNFILLFAVKTSLNTGEFTSAPSR